jgi:hypothetical protein
VFRKRNGFTRTSFRYSVVKVPASAWRHADQITTAIAAQSMAQPALTGFFQEPYANWKDAVSRMFAAFRVTVNPSARAGLQTLSHTKRASLHRRPLDVIDQMFSRPHPTVKPAKAGLVDAEPGGEFVGSRSGLFPLLLGWWRSSTRAMLNRAAGPLAPIL